MQREICQPIEPIPELQQELFVWLYAVQMLGYQAESASAKQVNRGFVHCAVKAEWCVKKKLP